MRVITGSARGRKLRTLEGPDVRPTTDKVKEAIFSSIQFDIAGAAVLDLFAGSGQLGIEALSRDAGRAVFVDSSPKAIEVITDNVNTTGFASKSRIVSTDFKQFLQSCGETFDIIFLDPPYYKGILQQALLAVGNAVNENSILVCESGQDEALPDEAGGIPLYRSYKHGSIKVTVYKKQSV